jgi:glutathione S-transferase
MTQPIQAFYWPTPNGHKITIALEELALPYEIHAVNIGKGDQFKPEFLAISPNNRMPAIVDPEGPDGQPISIFESGAILQYLARKTGRLYGEGERGRTEIDQWLHWQMGGLGPMSGQANHFRNYAPAITRDQRHLAYGAIRYSDEVHRLYGVLNKRLEGREHIAGDFSIADIAAWPWVTPWNALGIVMDEFPNIRTWYDRVAARPAVQRALAKAEEVKRGPALSEQNADADAQRRVLFGQRAR